MVCWEHEDETDIISFCPVVVARSCMQTRAQGRGRQFIYMPFLHSKHFPRSPGLKCMTRLKSGGKGKTSHSPYRDDSEEWCFFFRRPSNGEDGIFFAALRWRCYRIPKLSPLRCHFRPFRGSSQLCVRLEKDVGRLHLLVFLPPFSF